MQEQIDALWQSHRKLADDFTTKLMMHTNYSEASIGKLKSELARPAHDEGPTGQRRLQDQLRAQGEELAGLRQALRDLREELCAPAARRAREDEAPSAVSANAGRWLERASKVAQPPPSPRATPEPRDEKPPSAREAREAKPEGAAPDAVTVGRLEPPCASGADEVVGLAIPDESPSSKSDIAAAEIYRPDSLQMREMKATIWETALLAGTPQMGLSGSAAVLACLAFSVAVQVIFADVALGGLSNVQGLPSQESARRWRLTDAHSYSFVDPGSFTSLASRVCAMDGSLIVSSAQADSVRRIEQYLYGTFGETALGHQGSSLTMLVLLTWWLAVAREVELSLELAAALWGVPRAEATRLGAAPRPAKGVALEALSRHRLISAYVVLALRVVIAVTLGVAGSLWLTATVDLPELVVYTIVLQFVLCFDERVFDAVVPLPARRLVSDLQPLRRPLLPSWRGCGLQTGLGVGLCLLCSLCFYVLRAVPLKQQLQDIHEEMCQKGPLAFAVSDNAERGWPLIVRTNEFNSEPWADTDISSSWFRNAVSLSLAPAAGASPELFWYPLVTVDQGDFLEQLHITPEEEEHVTVCLDYPFESHPSEYLSWLRDALDEPTASSCEDLKHHCGRADARALRYHCGRTCGCNSPTSGLLHLTGCRPWCLHERSSRQTVLPCSDVSSGGPGGDSLVFFGQQLEPLGFRVESEVLTAQDFLGGCESIQNKVSGSYLAKSLLCLYEPMQALCPMLCQCQDAEQDALKWCPPTCKNSSLDVTDHSCSHGLCRPGSRLLQNETCQQWDTLLFGFRAQAMCIFHRIRWEGSCCRV